MADAPSLTDYVSLIINLFELFKQYRREQAEAKLGRPFTYTEEAFILFFMVMQYRQIHAFKAQRRWLEKHPEMLEMLGWAVAPDRTTISRRYKALYEVVQEVVLFVGQYASEFDAAFLMPFAWGAEMAVEENQALCVQSYAQAAFLWRSAAAFSSRRNRLAAPVRGLPH
jgi:hypothetical protein